MNELDDHVSASPLTWPQGWKRTTTPIRSRFSYKGASCYGQPVTISRATNSVIDELRLMGFPHSDIIISTNLRLKQDGYPYSNQREPEDQGVSVWWQDGPSRKVLALDKYDRIADNLYAIAKTINAMRGIERWGSGEILERTFEGFKYLPDPDHVNWRAAFGIEPDQPVTYPEVKTIYRRKMHEVHSDKNNTDETMAITLNKAIELCKQEIG